jgi:ferredoxin-NADP reductase
VTQPQRLNWRVASISEIRDETARAKTLVLEVPGWLGHQPGQHVDIRLTAEDGYQAQRSYSIASLPATGRLELTIECIEDGEVSPFLTLEVQPGDEFELRGPIGGYFVWDSSSERPLFLVGGGSGLVPLMAMLRQHRAAASKADARLLVSARTLDDVLYRDELYALGDAVSVSVTLTRSPLPAGWRGFARRIDRDMLAEVGQEPARSPAIYVCGPTPFVEGAARLLVELGHQPESVYTERFGPTGGRDGQC